MTGSALRVSAPGKLFLVGEYAVLEGGTAVIAAVDRRANGRLIAGAPAESPLVVEATRLSRAALAARGVSVPSGTPVVDSSALTVGTRKLGLGSSASAAAAAVGAIFAEAGLTLDDERARIFEIAEGAHRAAQAGRGSGGDVAAAVYGGVLAYGRPRAGRAEIRPLRWPTGVRLEIFSTGVAATTADQLRRVEELAARRPGDYLAQMDALRTVADEFLQALLAADGPRLVEAARSAADALAALGQTADVPIVTPPFAAATALARALGGAAKPSGAGGGDVGVALFLDGDAAARFRERAPQIGLEVLNIATAAPGLRRDN
jgi:mevalonate kinase